MDKPLLSYDTVCLYPKYSNLKSRSDANTSVNFCGYKFNLPVIPANMEDVISFENAKWLSENGYFYIMHRFHNATFEFLKYAKKEKLKLISVSIGTDKSSIKNTLGKFKDGDVHFVTIDVAHADHKNIEYPIWYVRSFFPSAKLIVGNIATYSAAKYLYGFNVDAIKVGLGGGSICTTRYKTGFHLPTLESVKLVNDFVSDNSLPSFREQKVEIIADGGLKYYGDIAKALVFGATMVMSGGWFASCIDSPAKIQNGKKIYRGSTSFEMKGERKNIEGKILEIEQGITYKERLEEIKQALQSSISYAGGKDLSAFNGIQWGRIYN